VNVEGGADVGHPKVGDDKGEGEGRGAEE